VYFRVISWIVRFVAKNDPRNHTKLHEQAPTRKAATALRLRLPLTPTQRSREAVQLWAGRGPIASGWEEGRQYNPQKQKSFQPAFCLTLKESYYGARPGS